MIRWPGEKVRRWAGDLEARWLCDINGIDGVLARAPLIPMFVSTDSAGVNHQVSLLGIGPQKVESLNEVIYGFLGAC